MAELSLVIEAGAAGVPPPSGDGSSHTEACRLEKELFDVKGIFVNLGITRGGSF